MTFTAKELLAEIQADGTRIDDHELYSMQELWWESDEDSVIKTLQYGDFVITEVVIGKKGNANSAMGGTRWTNYIILEQNGRYFRLNGEFDSWDAKGFDGTIDEVIPTEKVVKIWSVAK